MQVKIYDIDDRSKPTFRVQCDLSDCFPDGGEEFEAPRQSLEEYGRVAIGGGAAPLTILERA